MELPSFSLSAGMGVWMFAMLLAVIGFAVGELELQDC